MYLVDETFLDNLLSKALHSHHHDYTKSIRMTSKENDLYTSILETINKQMKTADDWLKTKEAEQYFYEQTQLKANFFNDIENEMSTILNTDAKNYNDHFEKLYNAGATAGYKQLFQTPLWTEADKRAMFYVQNYGFDRIRNLSEECKTSVREEIWRGVAEGESMDKVARKIRDIPLTPLTNSSLSPSDRARMIAITETSRAVNAGTIQSYSNYGLDQVDILTVGEEACEECADLESQNPWPIQEATGLIPAHPLCRCTFAPHASVS